MMDFHLKGTLGNTQPLLKTCRAYELKSIAKLFSVWYNPLFLMMALTQGTPRGSLYGVVTVTTFLFFAIPISNCSCNNFLPVFFLFIYVSIFICNKCRVAMHFHLPALSCC